MALKEQLSEEHFAMIIRITASSKEKKFVETKAKLKNKFELLYESKYKRPYGTMFDINRNTNQVNEPEEAEPESRYTNTSDANRTMNQMDEPEEPEPESRYTNTSDANQTTNQLYEPEEPEPESLNVHEANTRMNKAVKNCVLDLAGNIPENQRNILNLGPKFNY